MAQFETSLNQIVESVADNDHVVKATKLEIAPADSASKKESIVSKGDGMAGFIPDKVQVHAAKTEFVVAKNFDEMVKENLPRQVLLRRRVTNERDYPFCTIGKVFVGHNTATGQSVLDKTGSGALVGANILLTAGHVVPWGVDRWWMKFVPAFRDGTPEFFGHSFVSDVRGYYDEPDNVDGMDYAICKLRVRLGDRLGFMGYQSYGDDDDYYRGSWTSVGYPNEPTTNPGARFMMVEENVRIVDVDDDRQGKELESSVYSFPGWSGGPLYGTISGGPRVIGVMAGQETDFLQPRHTVNAGGRALADLVSWGRINWV